MVMDAVVYHPSVSHYLKFVATTVGRDKVMRTVQYFARFYAWYLYRLNGTPAEIAPWNAAKNQLGMIRKALRLGKFVEHIKAAAQAYDAATLPLSTVFSSSSAAKAKAAEAGGNKMDPLLRYLAIGRQLGYTGYMTFDNMHFFHVSGINKMEPAFAKKIQDAGYRSWFAGIACNAVAGVYQLYRLRERKAKLDLKDGDQVVEARRIERERQAVNLQLLSDICDIMVPSIGLGIVPFLDDGIVGLGGTVSSLIGVYSVWKKTAA